jgi:hypothetical protein
MESLVTVAFSSTAGSFVEILSSFSDSSVTNSSS